MATPFEDFINAELPLRQTAVKSSGVPSAPAPKYTQYIDTDSDDRYEQRDLGVGTNWVLISLGNGPAAGTDVPETVVERTCAPGLTVGDLVMGSTSVDGAVDGAVDNTDARPIVGICVEKVSSTDCKVRLLGPSSVVESGLSKGKEVFLGVDGRPSSSAPAAGYVQVLGICSGDSSLDMMPMTGRRVLRS